MVVLRPKSLRARSAVHSARTASVDPPRVRRVFHRGIRWRRRGPRAACSVDTQTGRRGVALRLRLDRRHRSRGRAPRDRRRQAQRVAPRGQRPRAACRTSTAQCRKSGLTGCVPPRAATVWSRWGRGIVRAAPKLLIGHRLLGRRFGAPGSLVAVDRHRDDVLAIVSRSPWRSRCGALSRPSLPLRKVPLVETS